MRKALALLPLLLLAQSLWSQAATRYLEIIYPEAEDAFMAYGDYANYDQSEFLIQFDGKVSPDARKIRVLWTSWDGRGRDDFVLTKFAPGDEKFIYRASKKLVNLEYGSNRYRFIATFADGAVVEKSLVIYLIHGHLGEKAKPVIYVYPEAEAEVSVLVSPKGGLTTSIPSMGQGWRIKARPDGILTDLGTGRDWPYLFWESRDYGPPPSMDEGFVISREEIESWFTSKLSFLGLRGKELGDFLEYWRPILSTSPWVFIRFQSRERIDAEAPLVVEPRPDSVIRVYFEYLPLEEPVPVRAQALVEAQRKGFAVVEWGGRKW